ncbi:acyltransferase [bacterium]|nr:acyltransferase [bacterium]
MRQDKNAVKIGSNTHIRGFLQVYKSCGNIEIGDYCYVGEYSNIWSAKDIKIGNNVLIAHGVDIYDHDTHPLNHLERAQHFRDIITKGHPDNVNWGEKPVIIKDYAWIASKAIILKGVTIGKGAIVAAGSVVVHDVEDFTVVAGNPAKVIKRLKND